jgi:hypothetical protein
VLATVLGAIWFSRCQTLRLKPRSAPRNTIGTIGHESLGGVPFSGCHLVFSVPDVAPEATIGTEKHDRHREAGPSTRDPKPPAAAGADVKPLTAGLVARFHQFVA